MIELKEAINIAKSFVDEIYGKEDSLLESAFFNENERVWYVSFSIPRKFSAVSKLQETLGFNRQIAFKTLKIDETGKVLSMEMDFPFQEIDSAQNEPKQLESI